MEELLGQLVGGRSPQLHFWGFLFSLAVSFAASLAAEGMYLVFYPGRATGAQIHRSFILIGPAVTLLFICVQLSLPLSLGLLGALSIVRFRTPIREPEEIGFIMLLIAGSIASATSSFLYLAVLYAAVFCVLFIRQRAPWRGRGDRRDGVLLISLRQETWQQQAPRLEEFLRGRFKTVHLESVASSEGLTSLHYVFQGARFGEWAGFHAEIGALVELAKVSTFFSRQGGLR